MNPRREPPPSANSSDNGQLVAENSNSERPGAGRSTCACSGLLTDLYELTMAAGYLQTHFEAHATFELFARSLPPRRNYLVAAGLEQALEFVANVRFTPQEVAYLRRHPVFRHVKDTFFEFLTNFRFTGDVWAMPEGTVAFAGEPILRVTAPVAEAQILETALLATINFQTMIASKAARVVTAARGRPVVEFGARRAHGCEASLLVARAATIGGCEGTSNTLAGPLFGISTYGTQAHSWVMAHENEAEAFRHFLDVFPEHAYLLVDTYEVPTAVKTILAMGRKPAGIRLDSGNLTTDSRWARQQLDRAGWTDVKIFASGDLNEDKIASLLGHGAAIDAFGVGSALATPSDAPNLNLIYKLVEVERGGQVLEAAKFSKAKATYPGRKQVFRYSNPSGQYTGDVIALADEQPNGGEILLDEVVRAGKRLLPPRPVSEARARCLASLERFPARFRQLSRTANYPIHYSAHLRKLLKKVRQRVRSAASGGVR
jgi:nicotinate phosphoribosyltransferase